MVAASAYARTGRFVGSGLSRTGEVRIPGQRTGIHSYTATAKTWNGLAWSIEYVVKPRLYGPNSVVNSVQFQSYNIPMMGMAMNQMHTLSPPAQAQRASPAAQLDRMFSYALHDTPD